MCPLLRKGAGKAWLAERNVSVFSASNGTFFGIGRELSRKGLGAFLGQGSAGAQGTGEKPAARSERAKRRRGRDKWGR